MSTPDDTNDLTRLQQRVALAFMNALPERTIMTGYDPIHEPDAIADEAFKAIIERRNNTYTPDYKLRRTYNTTFSTLFDTQAERHR